MADDKKEKEVDPRLEFLGALVMKTFRVKIDKWNKLLASDDKVKQSTVPVGYALVLLATLFTFRPQTTIFEWFDDPEKERLCFGVGSSGGIVVFNNFPTSSKSKVCYFLKKSPTEITATNLKEVNLI